MLIKYDEAADAMYITLNANPVTHTKTITDTVAIDFDAEENIVGVELLWVSNQVTNPFEVLYQLLPKGHQSVKPDKLPTEAEALNQRRQQSKAKS